MSRKFTVLPVLFLTLTLVALLLACRSDPDEVTPEAPTPAITLTPTRTPRPQPTFDPSLLDNPPDWAPQLVAYSPAAGVEGLLDGAITLRFDQPMNPDSVQNAFSIDPAVDGSFMWVRPDTLVFTPESELARDQRYSVQVSDQAEGINGLPLREPVDVRVQTVGFLQVSSITPADGTGEVAPDGAVTVLFNRPVVPLVSTGDQARLPNPLQISPETPGRGEWLSTSIFRFVPDGGWAGGTRYQLTIPAGLTDITGGVLETPVVSTFTTQRPLVEYTVPFPGQAGFLLTDVLTVTFNMSMDRASTQEAIRLDPPAAATYEWSFEDRIVTIRPRERLAQGTDYTLSIGQGARSAFGQASLDQTYEIPFSTVPFPAVVNTEPPNGSDDRQASGYVYIEFAGPMDWKTIDGRITVSPRPAKITYDYFPGGNWLTLLFEQKPSSDYTITIPGTAADIYGNTLGDPYTFAFRTARAFPMASFGLPYGINHLSRSFATEVTIVHRNVSALEVQLYDLGLPVELADGYYYQGLTGLGNPLNRWTVNPTTAENAVGTTRLPLSDGRPLPNGVYRLTLTAPEFKEQGYGEADVALVVADTNLVVKEMVDSVHVWATDIASGRPAAGRLLALYSADRKQLGTAETDANGRATFSYNPIQGNYRGVAVISETPGKPGFGFAASQWSQGAEPAVSQAFGPENPQTAYLFTDRPLYRPGDTVYFRAIVRQNDYGRYRLPDPAGLKLTVFQNQFFDQTNPFELTMTLETNADGSVFGQFELPADAQLGQYVLNLQQPNGNHLAQVPISVLAFRKPEVEVTVSPEKAELQRGEATRVTAEARYFFGAPAADLRVAYEVFDERFIFAPNLPYNFTDDDIIPFYGHFDFAPPEPGGFFGEPILIGSGHTGADGRFTLSLPADLLNEIEAGSRRITVQMTVTDVNNQIVSARAPIIFHGGPVYAGTQLESYVAEAGEPATFNLIAVDWQARPVASTRLEAGLYQRTWERDENGFYEPVDTLLESQTVTTDADGLASVEFTPPEGGTYRMVTTVGSGPQQHRSSVLFWASGEQAVWRPEPFSRRMDLVPDRSEYQVGETAVVLVQSPFDRPTTAWVSIERGTLRDERIVTLDGPGDTIAVPITVDDVPNIYVTVIAIKEETVPAGASAPAAGDYADIRVGVANLPVKRTPLLLNLQITPRLPAGGFFGPGETAVFDLQLTDAAGQPAAGELSLAQVDKALLSLMNRHEPPIADVFYSQQPYRSKIGASLILAADGATLQIEEQVKAETRAAAGVGGGGDMAADGVAEFEAAAPTATAAASQQGESAVRRDFRDTAFWEAVVKTDGSGRATIEIPLPDNLTTWELMVKAVTADTKVEQGTAEITVNKPLLLRPITPRFFTAGDTAQIGTVVNNNTNAALDVRVGLEAAGVELQSPAEQTVSVPAGGQTVVRWTVAVPDVSHVDLTFTAASDPYSDATKPTLATGPGGTIPVYRYNAEDIVATSGVVGENEERRVEAVLLPEWVDPEAGSLRLQLNASLAAAVLDGLAALDDEVYDRNCANAIAYRLLPNAVTARAINTLQAGTPDLRARLDTLIPLDVADLSQLQKADGGWGWCYARESDPYFSAYVLLALDKAGEAGYAVSRNVLNRGAAYLQGKVSPPRRLNTNAHAANQQVFYLYVLAEVDAVQTADLAAVFAENRPQLDPYAKAFLLLANQLGGGAAAEIDTLLADLNAEAQVSATGAHWESRGFGFLSGDIRDTAIVLMALARAGTDEPFGPQAVNWLMGARKARFWSTAHDSSWVLLALTDWLAATGELDADYSYAVRVHQTPLEGRFSRANIAETAVVEVPIGDLTADDLNLIDLQKRGNGRLYYNGYLDLFIPAGRVEAIQRGISVERRYFDAACSPQKESCEPLTSIQAGQQVRVELNIIATRNLVYAIVEDYFPAGAEGIDPNLQTSPLGLEAGIAPAAVDYRYGWWGWWFFNHIQFEDDRVRFTADFLPQGTYQYTYYLQAVVPGEFQVRPAFAREEFTPEVNGRSDGTLFTISP